MNKSQWTAVFFILILLAGYIFTQSRVVFPERNVVVAVSKVKSALISSSLSTVGTITAEQGVEVSSKISGTVNKIYFQSGQLVHKGDLLVSLENEDSRAQLDESMAKLNLLKQDFSRYSMLYTKGNISAGEYDKKVSELASAQSQSEYETALFNQTLIRAPFDGKVGICKVNIGQFIQSGLPLVRLETLSELYVNFNISQQYINQLKEGAQVRLYDDSFGSAIITGKVIALGSQVDLDTRSLPVRAIINNTSTLKLLPGMYVQIALTLSDPKPTLFVPQTAIMYGPLGESVYRINNKKFTQVKVKTGERREGDISLLEGLSLGDEVVCAGQMKLHPGVRLKTVPFKMDKQSV